MTTARKQARDRSRQRHQQTLGEDLSDDVPGPGAERKADGDFLPRATGRARE